MVTSSGVISLLVGNGKKVSEGSSVLDMVQCKQFWCERFLGCMTEQGDVEECSWQGIK